MPHGRPCRKQSDGRCLPPRRWSGTVSRAEGAYHAAPDSVKWTGYELEALPTAFQVIMHSIHSRLAPQVARVRSGRCAAALGVALVLLTLFGILIMPPHERVAKRSRPPTVNNLRHVCAALHNYVPEHHDSFPPAASVDAEGKPLLSWRVLILPYLGQDELFREFEPDAPWDSPHNLALLKRRPADYANPRGGVPEPHATNYLAVVGRGAAFDGQRGSRLSDFGDGLSNTLLVVESNPPVPWTGPQDLRDRAPTFPCPRWGGSRRGDFMPPSRTARSASSPQRLARPHSAPRHAQGR